MPLTPSQPNIYSNSSWTMAIASKASSLARWWGQPLEQVSEFSLRLSQQEDAKESENSGSAQTVVLKGNSAQLESLSELTEAYVQSLLVQSIVSGISSTLEKPVVTLAEDDLAFPDDMPEWQADEGYCHRLYLGSLQVEPLMSELKVTTTQLHDLSEIFQEVLPSMQPSSVRSFPMRSLAWPKTAAAAAVAIGLTSGLAWYVTGGGTLQTASEPEREIISLDPATPTPSNPDGLNLPPNFQAQPAQPKDSKSKTKDPKDLPATRKPNVVVPTAPTSGSPSPSDQASPEKNKTAEPQKQDAQNTSKPDAEGKPEPKPDKKDVAQQVASVPQKKPAGDAPAATSGAIANSDQASSGTAKQTDRESSIVAAESEQADLSAPREQVAAAPQPPAQPAPQIEGFSAARRAPTPPVAPPSVATENVLTFFQSQWQGQDSLSQSLSYRIEVQPDGTVSTVTPRNNLASVQIEQTPVPAAGARLTPPFSSSNPISFDVTLYPDGTVSVK